MFRKRRKQEADQGPGHRLHRLKLAGFRPAHRLLATTQSYGHLDGPPAYIRTAFSIQRLDDIAATSAESLVDQYLS